MMMMKIRLEAVQAAAQEVSVGLPDLFLLQTPCVLTEIYSFLSAGGGLLVEVRMMTLH